MSVNICSRLKILQNARIITNLNIIPYCSSRSCSTDVRKKLEDYFFDRNVQSILKKITGLNYDKVFCRRNRDEFIPDKFEFVTEEKLKEMFDAANAKAVAKLQMPPVMSIREPISDEPITKDPELQYYLDTKLLFIDTSPSKNSRNRIMTLRETDGTLRKANWEERIKLNQMFFPIEGRYLETPKMFESPQLDKLLEEGEYEFILDATCAQFEPDDPEYHRVTNATYEHIKSRKAFDILRSTRHFGPMAFYFAVKKDINHLLVDMLERQLIGDVAGTIRLLYILNPDIEKSDKEMDDTNFVKDYIQRSKFPATPDLELAFQTFLEAQSNVEAENSQELQSNTKIESASS